MSLEGEVAVLALNSPPVDGLFAVVRDGRADLTGFGGARKGTPLPDVLDLIVQSEKPVLAAIHGTALGGGVEVALCCHYRIAVPSAQVGLPRVSVGLLPGAGGTQRLPRIVGVETARELITFGTRVPAVRAEKLGILYALVGEAELRAGAVDFAVS